MNDPRKTLADRFGLALVPDRVAEADPDAVLICLRLDQVRPGVAVIQGASIEVCSGCGAAVIVSPQAIKARRICAPCSRTLTARSGRAPVLSVTQTAAAQAALWFSKNGKKQ